MAGYALYHFGVLQKLTDKFLKKAE